MTITTDIPFGVYVREKTMVISDGFKARLEFVLQQVFECDPDGGHHKKRAFVAARLLAAAQRGVVSLKDLKTVAEEARSEAVEVPEVD